MVALGRWRLEEQKFKASSGYTVQASLNQLHETSGEGEERKRGRKCQCQNLYIPYPGLPGLAGEYVACVGSSTGSRTNITTLTP